MLQTNNIIANRYEIQELVGSGKFGAVFKGIVLNTNKNVAIKMENNDNNECSTLKHESIIINYLHEKNVENVPVICWFGFYKNMNCLVMPFYNCSLFDHMKNVRDKTTCYGFIHKMIEVIKHVHNSGVLHRDIKPHNFMIDATKNEVVLIDFGMATFHMVDREEDDENEKQKKEHVVGTPKYMSVFVHDGFSPSWRDDMISLGYVFIWLMQGHLSWSGDNTQLKNAKTEMFNQLKNMSVNENTPNHLISLRKYMMHCHSLRRKTKPHYDGLINLWINL